MSYRKRVSVNCYMKKQSKKIILSIVLASFFVTSQSVAYAKEEGEIYSESIDGSDEYYLFDEQQTGEEMEENQEQLEENWKVSDDQSTKKEQKTSNIVENLESEGKISEEKDNFTGLRKEVDGFWYYFIDGVIQDTYTGLVQYSTGTLYYVEDGKIRHDVTGIVSHTDGILYYVQKGMVKNNFTELIKHTDGKWYYIVNGKVDNDYTGLAKYVTGTWYYMVNGVIRYDKTGLVKHVTGTWYYIENGRMKNNFSGLVKYTDGSWYYIKNGKKDSNYVGLVRHTTGSWYYVKNGKMQSNYTGLAKHISGTWYYVVNGKWNSSFNGTVQYNGKYYTVKNGKKYGTSLETGAIEMLKKAQTYSSRTKWLILVDTKQNRVGIYNGSKGNWTQQNYWSCTTGAVSTPTVKGQFTVGIKGKSFGNGYTCWYYTQFYGNYLFHSVLYNPGSMSSIQDGRLGINASHGCVRLSLGNAKWIYDNIPYSTKVVVY